MSTNKASLLPLGLDELLSTTRAVRKRLDLARPVPREVVQACIDVAIQAPNGSNQQFWHWLVVDDAQLKAPAASARRGRRCTCTRRRKWPNCWAFRMPPPRRQACFRLPTRSARISGARRAALRARSSTGTAGSA
jgi:nitroreductase